MQAPLVRDALGRVGTPVLLGDPHRILPQFRLLVHLHRALPILTFEVPALGLAVVAVGLKLPSEVDVGLAQEIFSVETHQPDHLVKLPVALIHLDREVVLLHRQVHLLSFLVPSGGLELLAALHVQLVGVRVSHVAHRDFVCVFPLVSSAVHLHSLAGLTRAEEAALGLLVVPRLLVVPPDSLVKALELVVVAAPLGLALDNLQRLFPVFTLNSSLDSFDPATSLDEVVDGGILLLHVNQVIAPLFLQRSDLLGR